MDEKKRRASSVWEEFERRKVGFLEKEGRGEGWGRKGISIEEMDETEEKKFHWKKPRVFLFKKKKKNADKINAIFLIFNKNLKKR